MISFHDDEWEETKKKTKLNNIHFDWTISVAIAARPYGHTAKPQSDIG